MLHWVPTNDGSDIMRYPVRGHCGSQRPWWPHGTNGWAKVMHGHLPVPTNLVFQFHRLNFGTSHFQHVGRWVDTDNCRCRYIVSQLDGDIGSPRRDVQQFGMRYSRCSVANDICHASSPTDIHPKCQHSIDRIVPSCDMIEHGPRTKIERRRWSVMEMMMDQNGDQNR